MRQFTPQFRQNDQQRRRQYHTELAAHTAQHDNGQDDGRLDKREALRADEPLAGGEEGTRKAAEQRAQAKGCQLGVRRVDAE